MIEKAELETRLRRQAHRYEAAVPRRPDLEARILSSALTTPPAAAPRTPLLRELAVAAGLLLVGGALGYGVIQFRAARHATVATSPRPTATVAATASAPTPVAPTLGPSLSYAPGIPIPRGALQLGSVYSNPSFRMFTPLRGWAVGPGGKGNGGDHDGLLVTADGGAHWRNVTPPGSSGWTDRTNFFLDLGHAWVAVTPHVVQHPTASAIITVYRTTDGANSWQRASFQATDGSPSQLTFSDPMHGWLVLQISQGDAIYRTSDGGITWHEASSSRYTQPGTTPPSGALPMITGGFDGKQLACDVDPFDLVKFLDASTGWAVGGCHGPTATPYFYVTRDGGSSWQPQELPGLATGPCPCWVNTSPPALTSPRDGTLTVTTGTIQTTCRTENGGTSCGSVERPTRAFLYASSDAGKSWTPHALPGIGPFGGDPAFAGARTGWYAAAIAKASASFEGETAFDKLYFTHDGGTTWAPLASHGSFPGGRLQFFDRRIGWAVPASGDLPITLLRTGDGGQTWQSFIPMVDG